MKISIILFLIRINHQTQSRAYHSSDHCRRPEAGHLDREHHQHKPGEGEVVVVDHEAEEVEQSIEDQPAQQEEQDVQGLAAGALTPRNQQPEEGGRQEQKRERADEQHIQGA